MTDRAPASAVAPRLLVRPRRKTSRLPTVRQVLQAIRLWFPPVVFSAMLLSPPIKSDTRFGFVPIDLTLLLALLVVGAVFAGAIGSHLAIPRDMILIVVLFMSFAASMLWNDVTGEYGQSKVVSLFSITLLSTAAPLVIFRTPERIRAFIWSLTILAGIVAIDAIIVGTSGFRLGGFSSNPIWSGRFAGAGLIITAAALFARRRGMFLMLGSATIFSAALLLSGSRGPVVAAGLVIAGMWAVTTWRAPRKSTGLVAVALLVIGVASSLNVVPEPIRARLAEGPQSLPSSSILDPTRAEYLSVAWEDITHSPGGIGWGAFDPKDPTYGPSDEPYPHNVLAEVVVESGWLAGVLLIIVSGVALARTTRIRNRFHRLAIASLLLFFALNSLVSGDINDNGIFFAMIGVSFAAAALPQQKVSDPVPAVNDPPSPA